MPESLSHITTESQWRSLVLKAGGKYWHVYMSKKTAGGRNTARYLGRYLKKPPIAASRLAHYNEGTSLSFRYLDHKSKRTARAVLTGMCYSAGSAMRHGSSSLTRLTGQSAMTPGTWRR